MEPCSAPNTCLEILPRLERVERDLMTAGKDIAVNTNKIEAMQAATTEREKTSGKLFALLICIVGVTVVHFCAFLLWVGRTSERLDNMQTNDKAQTEAIHKLESGKP